MSNTRKTECPNIILINCDDLGYGDLGCYGSSVNQTPNIDRMSETGLRFTNFYMASPVCSPSRAAMMTGCYPRRIGFGGFDDHSVLYPGDHCGLNPSEITIARLLKNVDYSTKLVGKWHCGDQEEFLPTRHGFDSYYGLPYSNDMGRQVCRQDFPPLPLLRDEEVIQQQPDQAALTERYVEECVRFIRESRDRPFFLYFAHMHVHLPIYAPRRFLRSSQNGPYGAAVECVDWSVGVILHELSRLNIDNKTIVVFTSDNGSNASYGGSNNPLRGKKGTTWEGGMRVPCIVRWPGVVPAGRSCDELVTSMDFYPTFTRIAGATLPVDRIIDGKDIGPLLMGEPGARTPHEDFFYYSQNDLEAIRVGSWKLYVSRRGKKVHELYNLDQDIGETCNVIDQNLEVLKAIEDRATRIREDIGDEATGFSGRNCRVAGYVEKAKTLTQYDAAHPYIIAMYDLPDSG